MYFDQNGVVHLCLNHLPPHKSFIGKNRSNDCSVYSLINGKESILHKILSILFQWKVLVKNYAKAFLIFWKSQSDNIQSKNWNFLTDLPCLEPIPWVNLLWNTVSISNYLSSLLLNLKSISPCHNIPRVANTLTGIYYSAIKHVPSLVIYNSLINF